MWPFKSGSTTLPDAAQPQAEALAAQARRQADPQKLIDLAVAEMASNHLGKQSKLSLAQDAVMLRDLQQLSETEHRDQRNFKAAKLGGPWLEAAGDGQVNRVGGAAGDDMGGILICDDYHYNDRPQVVQPRPAPSQAPWGLAAAVGVVAAALGGAALAVLLNKPEPAPAPPPPNIQKIENREGFLIELVPPALPKP